MYYTIQIRSGNRGKQSNMLVAKGMPYTNFTKIDNEVIKDKRLSDGAKVLYCYIALLPNGKLVTDGLLKLAMNCSQAVITRRKRELKEHNLLLIDQVGPKLYNMFIGCTAFPASTVKAKWKENGLEELGNGE